MWNPSRDAKVHQRFQMAEGCKMVEQVAIAKVEAGNVSSYIPNFKSLSKGEKLDMATKMAVVSY